MRRAEVQAAGHFLRRLTQSLNCQQFVTVQPGDCALCLSAVLGRPPTIGRYLTLRVKQDIPQYLQVLFVASCCTVVILAATCFGSTTQPSSVSHLLQT
jgi:hypothetical protein